MRYVPIFCLRKNMILGVSLYGHNNELMLREGTELTNFYIDKIKELKYNGLYIIDDLSENIEISRVISDTLRREVIKGAKHIFLETGLNDIKATKNSAKDIQKMILEIIDNVLNNKDLMINMIDLKLYDNYTYYHSANVAVLSLLIGVALKLSQKQLYELCLGALMHDIGKVFIQKNIIKKPGKLTSEEYDNIKNHPELGSKYIKNIFSIPDDAIKGIEDHHERFDGNGYPKKTSKEQISLYGRIISIADVYDALTSDRPYRKGIPSSEAIECIVGGSGTQFDHKIVEIFVSKIATYPLSTCIDMADV